jgi:hypothetical protein
LIAHEKIRNLLERGIEIEG